MNPQPKSQKPKKNQANPLEALRDFSSTTVKPLTEEFLKPTLSELPRQLFNLPTKRISGELQKGGSFEVSKNLSQENQKEKASLKQERRLLREERALVNKKSQELKLQIEQIKNEAEKLVAQTPKLSQELKIAASQATVDPKKYHLGFFEHILTSIRKSRVHIENASTWLQALNKRSSKKNVWAQRYKKYGAKYLLSGEHYSQRAAA
jgi:hypothetical protein